MSSIRGVVGAEKLLIQDENVGEMDLLFICIGSLRILAAPLNETGQSHMSLCTTVGLDSVAASSWLYGDTNLRRVSEETITDTDDRDMAAPANIGSSANLYAGNNTPAAMGMRQILYPNAQK